MTYFKLDIPKINENLSRYNEIKNNCLENIGFIYNGLGYTESAWNDSNAYNFIEKVKSDKYKTNEYFEYLNSLYNEINNFKTNIDNLCSKQGYRKNTITLKFDDNEIEQAKKYLENAKWYLNDCLNKINVSDFEGNFDDLSLIYNLRSEIKSVRNTIDNIIEEVKEFVKSVNNEIVDSRVRIKRLGNFDFGLKVSEYKWKVADLNVKKVDISNLEEYSNASISKIKDNTKSANLSSNEFVNIGANKIETQNIETVEKIDANLYNSLAKQIKIGDKNFEAIKGLNNNINNHLARENNIEFDDEGQIKGLNNNLNINIAKEAKVEEKKFEGIKGLNDNINNNLAKENNIEFDDEGQIRGLNDNLHNVSLSDTVIEKIDTSKTQGLKNNINDAISNVNNIDFTASKTSNLGNNVENAKVNNNSIDYTINTNVSVGDNIASVNANQTNIDTSNIVSKNYDLGSGISAADPSEIRINSNINKTVDLDVNINKMESLKDVSDE